MSSELTIGCGFRFAKGSVDRELAPVSLARDVAGTKADIREQIVGITEEALVLGDIGVGGYVKLVNMDPTNFISVRAASGALDLADLLPGDVAIFRLRATAPYVIAHTAPCVLAYELVEA